MFYSALKRLAVLGAFASALTFVIALPNKARAQPFNLDTGNAPIEVVIPTVIPVIFATVNPSDASLVLRTTTILTNVFFDAIAPYHATAVGVYSRLPRRPASEGVTQRNRNIAIFYAALPALYSLYPNEKPRWDAMLQSVGLDPSLQSTDLTRPEGIGRAAGRAVMQRRERDGMNQLGDAGGRTYNRLPYADTTGYEPVNTAYELENPSRWQPAIVTDGHGIFRVQQFVTPQWAVTEPYSIRNLNQYSVAKPVDSQTNKNHADAGYKRQVDEVIAASANLTDRQKLTAELFNNKIESLGFVALFLSLSRNWTVEQFVFYDFLVNMAAFDGGIATWRQKIRYDAVRPVTAVGFTYGNQIIRAWGGPGKGTVNLPASEWRSYTRVADHPEYPSGSSCFCAAHAQASRRYLGSDQLNWSVRYAPGSSVIEPGHTPTAETILTFPTWTRFEDDCATSRVNAGVHFLAAALASKPMCRAVGDEAFGYFQSLVNGTAPAR